MQCDAMQCNAMRFDAMRCDAMQCNAMRCDAMQYNAMQYIAMQCNAMRCNAIRCDAMRCNAMQCNAMQCNIMQCNAIAMYLYLIIRPQVRRRPARRGVAHDRDGNRAAIPDLRLRARQPDSADDDGGVRIGQGITIRRDDDNDDDGLTLFLCTFRAWFGVF